MGKIKIRTLGTDEEELQKKAQKKKREEKKSVHIPGMKGGQRVVAVGPSEEELVSRSEIPLRGISTEPLKKKEVRKKVRPQRMRSKRYQGLSAVIDRNKTYDLSEGLELLGKMSRRSGIPQKAGKAAQDETVELHINTQESGISINTTLPHGTHKKTRVAIASDSLISEIEKGKIDFDVLLAESSMMPKLAKVAKVLGPKGLMPNPKAGTITTDPQKSAKKFEGGQMRIKTEAKFPIIHVSVGKMSFGPKKLSDNINAVVSAIEKENIKKVVLKSTQSPSIKLNI